MCVVEVGDGVVLKLERKEVEFIIIRVMDKLNPTIHPFEVRATLTSIASCKVI